MNDVCQVFKALNIDFIGAQTKIEDLENQMTDCDAFIEKEKENSKGPYRQRLAYC